MAALMVGTALTSCGSSSTSTSTGSDSSSTTASTSSTEKSDAAVTDSSDLPTVSLMLICGTVPSDQDLVAEALSEITAEKIGANVDFVPIEIGNATTQMNLLLSGGDDTLDVFWSGMGTTYASVVASGQALPLDDLLAPYEDEMKSALGENVYESGRVSGTLYGVGRLLDQASTAVFNLRADVAEKYGYSNGDKIDLDILTDLFRQIRVDYPDIPIIGPMNGTINMGDSRVDSLSNSNMLGVLGNYGQDTTVINYYESEYYDDLIGYYKEWSEMGAYMSDFMNVSEAPSDLIPAERCLGCFAGHFSAEMNGIWSTQNFGVEIASLQIYDDAVAVTPGAYYCINPASKNQEAAAALIYLMATDADVENLLINGVEGVDYQILDDGTAAYIDGKDASSTGWCMGYSWCALNSSISTPFNYPADYYTQMLDANASAKQSKAFGCQFDMTGVSDALSACTNVVSQYKNPIASGAVNDYDATVAEFREALKAAGIDEIIAAKQEQLDAFLAQK
jgi:putative aldouronate transport system substrate-binding protein